MLRRGRGRRGRGGGGLRREAKAPDTRLPASLRATLGLPTGSGNSAGGLHVGSRKRSRKRPRSPTRANPPVSEKKVREEDDPDKKEIRRLEKLLGIGKKRRKAELKGKKFSYASAFAEEEKDLADLIDFCSGETKEGVDGSDGEGNQRIDEPIVVPADPADDFDLEDEDSASNSIDSNMRVDFEIEAETDEAEDEAESNDGFNMNSEKTETGKEHDKADKKSSQYKKGIVQNVSSETPITNVGAGDAPSTPAGSYIPPSRRRGSGGETQRLGRRIRGLLNRLAEANAGGIANTLEGLFRSPGPNISRNTVISLYVDASLDAVQDGSATSGLSPFVAPHAAIVTHLAAVIDVRVVAELLSGTVRRIAKALPRLAEETEEEELQIGDRPQRPVFGYVALLGALYMRRAISAKIVHELVRALADGTQAQRVELLLALLRQIGPQLRADDPLSLKDMIAFLRERFQTHQEQLKHSAKINVMLDLISAVKNNKLRKGDVIEHNVQFIWAAKLESPLSATFAELLDHSFTEGRWWECATLTHSGLDAPTTTAVEDNETENVAGDNDTAVDLSALAASLRLNTDFRRSLFGAIMSSASVTDAYERVERLGGLSVAKNRDRDTARVILHCCAAERGYNPFYALLAVRMCAAARAMRFTFEHALCDLFRVVAAGSGGGAKKVSSRRLRNYAQFIADMLHKKALRLTVFKNVSDFESCPPLEKELFVRTFHALLRAVAQDANGNIKKLKEEVHAVFKDVPSAERDLRLPLATFLNNTVRNEVTGQSFKAMDVAVRVLRKEDTLEQLRDFQDGILSEVL